MSINALTDRLKSPIGHYGSLAKGLMRVYTYRTNGDNNNIIIIYAIQFIILPLIFTRANGGTSARYNIISLFGCVRVPVTSDGK